jgi:hypothetical protein
MTSFGNIVPNLRRRRFFFEKILKKIYPVDFEAFMRIKKMPHPGKIRTRLEFF